MRHLLLFCSTVLLLISSCNKEDKKNTSTKDLPQLSLTSSTEKILKDTTKYSPLVDSLRSKFWQVADTEQVILLNELSEYWSDASYQLTKEALHQSEKINYPYGTADALCRLAIYHYRHSAPDSAMTELKKALAMASTSGWDKVSAQAMSLQAEVYRQKGEFDTVHILHDKAIKIAQQISDKTRLSFCNISKAESYRGKSMFEKAFDCYYKAINFASEIGDWNKIATCYNSMGDIYRIKGDYIRSLEYFHKALDLARKNQNKLQIAYGLNSLGDIYHGQKEYKKALEYYNEGVKVALETGNKYRVANMYGNMGTVYQSTGNTDMAFECFDRALKINEENGYYDQASFALYNLGSLWETKGDLNKAEEYYKKALQLSEETENFSQQSDMLFSISELYLKMNKLNEAYTMATKSLEIAQELGLVQNIKNAAKVLSELNALSGNHSAALKMLSLYIAMKDSVSNDENIKQFAAVEYKAKEDKMKAEQIAKEQTFKAEQARKEEELKRQKTIRYAFTIGFGLVLILAIVIYRGLRLNKKQNKIILSQKKEVEHQKELVEEKNKEITDSITYAKRLQEAILPPVKMVKEFFPESFVLYKPKDIIAGDFYWMENIEDTIFFAAADSTGHGVPGAMVSVVCSNALNRAVKEFGLKEPGKILDKTRELVIETFEKSEGDVKDGMDISLISIKRNPNSEHSTISWSGANNPLWYISEGKLNEIKATKQPIGKSDNPQPFTTHEIPHQKGSVFYLLTDGFADQFGGPKGKKFKYKQLEELLLNNSRCSLEEQQRVLDSAFEEWKGHFDQVDDVTVIGIML
jgi:tetratricopeptide (TPR) repeat protein